MTVTPHHQPRCYRFGDLLIDGGRRRVCRGPTTIRMGRLSYDMLCVLVGAAPNVVTQDRFARGVWAGRLVTPETVTQRVKLLRDALDDDAQSPRYIGLVRGQGYRLLPQVTALNPQSRDRQSLAVLPFENLSRDPEDGYFAIGIHEEILSHLAKLRLFNVLARTSVRAYENTQRPITEIASELGVGVVVEGSIRYAKNRVRITAQLIDGASGVHLWADSFERDRSSTFAVQDEVARRIAVGVSGEV